MQRRSGFTLAEVLIAIFVLAIGLMGILALFPLGAMHMAQAIKDDRCGTSESNETCVAHVLWKDQQNIGTQSQRDPLCRNDYTPAAFGTLPPGYPYCPMAGPNAPVNPDMGPAPWPNGGNVPNYGMSALPPLPTANYDSSRQSYPVLVDPLGWSSNIGNPLNPALQFLVGGHPLSIPRRSIVALEYSKDNTGKYTIPNPLQTRIFLYNRMFVLLDDLSFGPDGALLNPTLAFPPPGQTAAPTNPLPPTTVQRDGRYSTAWMIRRPQTALDSQAQMTVIVYSGRGVTTPSAETVISNQAGPNVQFVQNSTEVLVDWGVLGSKPKLRKGNWILDATMANTLTNAPEPHGYFYRIIGVTDLGGTQMSLEIQQPAIASVATANKAGLLIMMDNVAEVFERKTLSPNIAPGQ
jgi:prepilin-type N-terminal cleavage/methylation domain-containing protein